MKDTRRKTVDGQPINPNFGEGRFQDALRRLKKRIENDLKLYLDDSNEIGYKHTHCSWGFCSNDLDQWPDKDDHTFPIDFERHGRIAPRTTPGGILSNECHLWMGHKCNGGCFYECAAFHQDRYGKLTYDRVLKLLNEFIEMREEKYGHKTTEDDDEPWRE